MVKSKQGKIVKGRILQGGLKNGLVFWRKSSSYKNKIAMQ